MLELTEKLVTEQQLTTLMITHNMRDALRYGNRLIMMHDGRPILDVRGEEKAKLTAVDLLQFFEKAGDGVDELAAYSGFPTEGRFIDNVAALPGFYKNTEKNEANAKAKAPRRYTDRNGNLVQPVPADELGWNNTYLDADKRGCTSVPHVGERADEPAYVTIA